MAIVVAHWADKNFAKFGKAIDRLNREFPKVIPREINKVGARAKTVVIRNLTKQTGLDRRVIVAAVGNALQARPGRLSYEMRTRGGNIRLKYLKPKETAAGVVAKPFGKATLYPGAFLKGGAMGNRKVVAKFDGHAMFRNGTGRHYTFARSGVFIPTEMTTGATLEAFNAIAGPLLHQRVEAVINKLLS
ncbi:MAG: hypothetical protein ACOH2J_22000 [Allorhizobium sp.]